MTILPVFGLALGVFLLVIIGMAVGVLLGKRQLKGSCGGLANQTSADGTTNCSLCSNSDNACRDLSRRMNGTQADNAPCESQSHSECQKDCVAEGCTDQQVASCRTH